MSTFNDFLRGFDQAGAVLEKNSLRLASVLDQFNTREALRQQFTDLEGDLLPVQGEINLENGRTTGTLTFGRDQRLITGIFVALGLIGLAILIRST